MHRGYVPIYRRLKEHWIYKDDKKLLAWIKILMEVNHSSKPVLIKHVLLDCNKGESLRSLDGWVDIFGRDWNKTSVRRFFKLLEKENMIRIKSETVTTRLTVCNHESYNENRNGDETEVKHKGNASETEVTPNNNDNNNKNVNKYFTSSQIDIIYKLYPKKVGKAKGYEKLGKTVYSDSLNNRIMKHIDIIKIEQTETKYHQNFSTYVNQRMWEDLEEDTKEEISDKEDLNKKLQEKYS